MDVRQTDRDPAVYVAVTRVGYALEDAVFHVDQRRVARLHLARLHLAIRAPRLHLPVQALIPSVHTLVGFALSMRVCTR